MPTPFAGGEVSVVQGTAPQIVLALSGGTKWGGPVGTGAVLSYSFPEPPATPALWSTASKEQGGYGPPDGPGEPWSGGFAALGEAQRAGVEAALQAWAAVADVTFAQVAETPDNVGDLRFATTDHTQRQPRPPRQAASTQRSAAPTSSRVSAVIGTKRVLLCPWWWGPSRCGLV